MPRQIGSKEGLRRYMRKYIGKVLNKEQLQQASGGASEWARRLRELRDDEGWLFDRTTIWRRLNQENTYWRKLPQRIPNPL